MGLRAHLRATRTRRRLGSGQTDPTCGGPARRTATARAREDAGRQRRPARAGGAGSGLGAGQGESAVRSGDGRAWVADTPSRQRRERGSNTHARLRTRRTGGQTHGHTRQWPNRTDTERPGVCLGSAGCLLVNGGLERDSGVLNKGLQGGGGGGGRLGACRGRRPGARSCQMLPGERLERF